MHIKTMSRVMVAFAAMLFATSTQADCIRAPEMDANFCDRNGDLVADLPDDSALWRNPNTLVWAYTPIEDPAVYANLFRPFTEYLSDCTGKQVVYYPVQSNAAEVAAIKSGRVHFAGFSTGPTVAAVNEGGAVPFAAKGDADGIRGYSLVAIVRADSPYHNLSDLEGKRVAHSTPLSNSGNIAPRALFPAEDLVPGQDYEPILSGGHDRSILGVLAGDYDMAAVASDVLERMTKRGMLQVDDLRVIYTSALFPTSAFVHAHDLHPKLTAQLKSCFFGFTFPPEMQQAFQGDAQFLPISYKSDWEIVRNVMDQTTLPDN
ncbi:phosphate/phosphite/phosphonate ABC transporter substrate-binding protein [Thalassospira alkalitolerans]|uniref:phosphate/phosphite/phosphonate ABC transporter substrate-binding protein n=1 Tax=Thalassospira alkalitolerans TaxID=1293890 RepID=UPI003AA7B2E8